MFDELATSIGNANESLKRLAIVAGVVDRYIANGGDMEAIGVNMQLLQTVGDARDRLSVLRLAPLKRALS